MNKVSSNLALWLVLGVIFLFMFNLFNRQQPREPEVVFSDFFTAVEKGEVSEVVIQGQIIRGKFRNDDRFKTYAPTDDPDLMRTLRDKGVRVAARPEEGDPWYITILIQWFPMLLLIGVWIFFMRQMQMGGGKAMSFGKSRAKLLTGKPTTRDVQRRCRRGGTQTGTGRNYRLSQRPQKVHALGGAHPQRRIAGSGLPEPEKPCLPGRLPGKLGCRSSRSAAPTLLKCLLGLGPRASVTFYIQGKKQAPCIIFIDEIDAVGRHRGAGLGGGHDEREQTLNQLLVEMDGFEANEGVILIAATNRPDVLDPALLRPGRFDRRVVVPSPDVRGRARKFLMSILVGYRWMTRLTSPDSLGEHRGFPGLTLKTW